MIDPKPWTYDYQENYEKNTLNQEKKCFSRKGTETRTG